jgi:YHS domain-containing protein
MVDLRTSQVAFALDEERALAVVDPVCGRQVELDRIAAQEEHEGWAYFFCSPACHQKFTANPARFAGFGSLEKDERPR